jgi:hypothetical protein
VRTSARARRRAAPLVALFAGCLTLASCAPRKTEISSAQFEAIQRQLTAQASDAATQAADASSTTPPGPTPIPPRDDAERRARALRALPKGVELGPIAVAGNGTRWLMALATPKRDDASVGPNLLLFDVAAPDGVLFAEHDFGANASDTKPPARIGRALLLDAASREEPVVLAELLPPEGTRDPAVGACGWWLRRRRAMFMCAPRLTATSRLDVHDGQVVESWQVDSLGGDTAGSAGRLSGRVLRFADGNWQESDSFRCLGTPLDQAWKEAGRRSLATWQQETVRTLTRSATHASGALDTDTAAKRLQDALVIDGCAPETWRLLGRLEFEAGKPGATRTLAMALALAPRDDGVLIDLADGLAVLRTDVPAQREAWRDVVAVLGGRPATRPWLEGAASKSPRALARVLYETYLARTSPDDEWLQARRRRVEEKLATLDAGSKHR